MTKEIIDKIFELYKTFVIEREILVHSMNLSLNCSNFNNNIGRKNFATVTSCATSY